jgi:hypothetical protein
MLYFFFDLAHYFGSAVLYRFWIRGKEVEMYEKTGTIEGEYNKPAWLDTLAFICFCVKIIILALIYLFLGLNIIMKTIQTYSNQPISLELFFK